MNSKTVAKAYRLLERDLVVAITACAAENTNQGRLKPIGVEVFDPGAEGG